MKSLILSIVSLILIIAAFAIGLFHGKQLAFKEVRKQMLLDVETATKNGNQVLAEVAKARYYYYSNRANIRLRRGEGDFGPIKEDLVKGFYPGKETSFAHEYERYKRIPGFAE